MALSTLQRPQLEFFEQVWKHHKMPDLVKEFLDGYSRFNKKRKAGQTYRVALVCKSGKHQSVAVGEGFYNAVAELATRSGWPIHCSLRHSVLQAGLATELCGGRCRYCRSSDWRDKWEFNLVNKVLPDDLSTYTVQANPGNLAWHPCPMS